MLDFLWKTKRAILKREAAKANEITRLAEGCRRATESVACLQRDLSEAYRDLNRFKSSGQFAAALGSSAVAVKEALRACDALDAQIKAADEQEAGCLKEARGALISAIQLAATCASAHSKS